MKLFIIVSDKDFAPHAGHQAELKKFFDLEILVHTGKLKDLTDLTHDTAEKVLALDPDAFSWELDAETLNSIPNVKAVFPQSTSFDWVNPKVLQKLGIQIINCAGFSTKSVAEYALAMAIDLARHLPIYIKNNWQIDWQAQKPMLLHGKTLGVIGLGKIGTHIARLGQGLGMHVICYSRSKTKKDFPLVSLEELFTTSDVIIPALAENNATKKLLPNKLLNMTRPTSYFVGLNRIKDLWDENHILNMVANNKLAGYAFEGDNAKSVTDYKGNIWPLPPMAWYTKDSATDLLQVWVDNLLLFAKGTPQNIVT